MTRQGRRALTTLAALLVVGGAACGKYGPPERSRPAPSPTEQAPTDTSGGEERER
jgi:hypothetical protein